MLKIRIRDRGMTRELFLEDHQAEGLKRAMAVWIPGKYEVLEINEDEHVWELKPREGENY